MKKNKLNEISNIPKEPIIDELNFWNHIMEEHAEFIDGLLDPTAKDQLGRASCRERV